MTPARFSLFAFSFSLFSFHTLPNVNKDWAPLLSPPSFLIGRGCEKLFTDIDEDAKCLRLGLLWAQLQANWLPLSLDVKCLWPNVIKHLHLTFRPDLTFVTSLDISAWQLPLMWSRTIKLICIIFSTFYCARRETCLAVGNNNLSLPNWVMLINHCLINQGNTLLYITDVFH